MVQVYAGIDYSRLKNSIRYGRDLLRIFWVYGPELVAPLSGSVLVYYKPPTDSGRRAWIYGFYIDSSEGNVFDIKWVSAGETKVYRFRTSGAGTLHVVFSVPINEGVPSDVETELHFVVVNAGSAGSTYRAALLIGETT